MAKVVKYKVPSQVASGSETFSDNLVGVQITDGTAQLTNTNFALDKVIPEKDSKNFKINPFSDFLTLDSLKKQTDAPTTQEGTPADQTIKFNGDHEDAGKSLFGSLKQRLLVSITKIIKKFPAAILVDGTSPVSSEIYTANNIVYNSQLKTTEFDIQVSMLYNPFDVVLTKPKSTITPTTDNELRNLFSSYTKYVLDYNNTTYDVVNYVEPNSSNVIKVKVNGNPFTGSTSTNNFLLRPNDGVTEEFFNNLDDIEQLLLDRQTNPKFQSNFKVPRDSFDESRTEIVSIQITWPITKDNWNIQIIGLNYDEYINNLSDIADEIDDYKSNLIVRFLAAPQLFEFDSEDKRAESIFQIYGQSFDSVKKYIDNIAYMRNVSYDGINNVPDILLKNLSETLGLSTINLFDEKSLEKTLYTRLDTQFTGLSLGKNLIDAEHEFYRRLLVNLAYIYKSKGTRSSIEFFLKFLGAPEPLIKINEYVYDVKSSPKVQSVQDDLYYLIQGVKTNVIITGFSESTYTYLTGTTTGSTSLTRNEYPIDENGLPRGIETTTGDVFFQKGSGWYDMTLNHRSSDVLDTDNSVLTGRTKTIKTKAKGYTYGEEYFDNFRTLTGLDYGFELTSRIDNLKGSVDSNESSYVLNRKNIGVYLSSSQGVEYDIYRQSRNLLLTFGTNSLKPQTGYTFAEYLNTALSNVILQSNMVKYKNNYIDLEDVYSSYLKQVPNPYDYVSVNEFIHKMSPYWMDIVSQFVPSTTLWTGGNIIENNLFRRSKYKYKKPCQIYEMIDDVYPETGFLSQSDIDLFTSWLGIESPAQPLDKIEFYPVIEIDGINYSGTTSFALMSGETTTLTSARLYQLYYEYEVFDFDFTTLNVLWKFAIIDLIDNVINKTTLIDPPGSISDYTPYVDAVSPNLPEKVYQKILSYEFFIDKNGTEKIRFKSLKYGPHSCTVMKSFNFKLMMKSYRLTEFDSCIIKTESNMLIQAENSVILNAYLNYECVLPTPTPTPTPTLTPTPTPTPTSTPTPTPTLPTPTPTPTSTPTPTPTDTPTPTPTLTPTPTPTATPPPTIPYTISVNGICSGINTSYTVNGGTAGDVIVVKASFSGVLQKVGGSFTRADLGIFSSYGTTDTISSTCYSDSGSHGFSLIANTTITMGGYSADVSTSAVYHNSFSSIGSIALTIVSINGNPVNIGPTYGCKGNSATGGTC